MDQMVIRVNGPDDYQGKMDQMAIRVKRTRWLSGKKGLAGYQSKIGSLAIKEKGTYWLSGEKDHCLIMFYFGYSWIANSHISMLPLSSVSPEPNAEMIKSALSRTS